MCLVIVDTHFIRDVLGSNCCQDLLPIQKAMMERKIRLVYGGTKLKIEYKSILSKIASLDRAGIAKLIPDQRVDNEAKTLAHNYHLSSNDPHIIALARVSGARLLCSNDQGLHCDFKNLVLVPRPKGNVYQGISHEALIKKPCAALEAEGA